MSDEVKRTTRIRKKEEAREEKTLEEWGLRWTKNENLSWISNGITHRKSCIRLNDWQQQVLNLSCSTTDSFLTAFNLFKTRNAQGCFSLEKEEEEKKRRRAEKKLFKKVILTFTSGWLSPSLIYDKGSRWWWTINVWMWKLEAESNPQVMYGTRLPDFGVSLEVSGLQVIVDLHKAS